MQDHVIVFSSLTEKEKAFSEVLNKINEASLEMPAAIIFFSDQSNFEYYTHEFYKNFPQVQIIGSTTYKNFTTLGISDEGLSAVVLYSKFECTTGVLSEVSKRPIQYIENVYNALDKLSGTENTLCLEFTTAFSNGEELVMDTFVKAFEDKDILVAGSSSGGRTDYNKIEVSLNGKLYKDSCVFILIHNKSGRIVLYKEILFKPTKRIFTATSVDCDNRKVYEYDNMPAALLLARNLNIQTADLNEYFLDHPMGRIYGDECFLMEGNEVLEDNSITYFSRIYNLTKVALMEPERKETVWTKTREDVSMLIENPKFMICINCLARTKMLENENQFEEFNENLKKCCNDFVGISGYGEQMNGVHFNQTMVMVLFE